MGRRCGVTGIPLAGSHNNVSASFKDPRYRVWVQVSTISQADLTLRYRCAIQSFTTTLIGQLKETEPLGGRVESAVDAPQLVFSLGGGPQP